MSGSEEGHVACPTESVSEGSPAVVDVDGVAVAVFSLDGGYVAVENTCPHQGGPLGEGKVEDGCVYCPWHGWQFDLETGEHVHGKATARTYDVHVEDGLVHVTLD